MLFKRKHKLNDEKLYVLEKDNFFGIRYNKIVKLVGNHNDYVIINLDRQRIQLGANNEIFITTTNENCIAKIVRVIDDKIYYLEIEGDKND